MISRACGGPLYAKLVSKDDRDCLNQLKAKRSQLGCRQRSGKFVFGRSRDKQQAAWLQNSGDFHRYSVVIMRIDHMYFRKRTVSKWQTRGIRYNIYALVGLN